MVGTTTMTTGEAIYKGGEGGGGSEPGGGGGGATHSLGVGTNCETTAPTFWQWTAHGFPNSKFTAPSFDRSSWTDPLNLQLSIKFFVYPTKVYL